LYNILNYGRVNYTYLVLRNLRVKESYQWRRQTNTTLPKK